MDLIGEQWGSHNPYVDYGRVCMLTYCASGISGCVGCVFSLFRVLLVVREAQLVERGRRGVRWRAARGSRSRRRPALLVVQRFQSGLPVAAAGAPSAAVAAVRGANVFSRSYPSRPRACRPLRRRPRGAPTFSVGPTRRGGGGTEALAHGDARCRERRSNMTPWRPGAWDMDCGLVSITPRAAARGARTRFPRWRS